MELLKILSEAPKGDPIPSQFDAAMSRYGSNEDDMSPERLVKLIKTLAQQGFIEPQMLDDFKQMHDALGKVLNAAEGGKLKVERPKQGSWYNKSKKQEKVPNSQGWYKDNKYRTLKKEMAQLVSTSQYAREEINRLITQEYMRRNKQGRRR